MVESLKLGVTMNRILLAVAAGSMLAAGSAQAAPLSILFAQDGQRSDNDTLRFVKLSDTSGYFEDINNPLVNFTAIGFNSGDSYRARLEVFGADANTGIAATTAKQADDGTLNQWLGAGTIRFTAVNSQGNATAINDGCLSGSCTNLLTVTFNSAHISGSNGGQSGGYLGSDPADGVVFTSDFFDFAAAGSIGENFSMALTGISPLLNDVDFRGPGYAGTLNSIIDGFTADATGSFNYQLPDPVPEPGMLGLFGLGAIGMTIARRRKK